MKALAAAAIAVVLAGCAALGRPVTEVKPGASADDFTAYIASLRGMSEARLAAEATRQREAAAREPGEAAKVKAAIVLSLAPHGDESEILALVEPVVAKHGTSSEVQGMASFLQAMAMERRRLRESAAAAGTRAREEHRAREQEKLRADAQQERAAQLQQKLDALSELEKSLSDRPPQGH